MTQPTPEQPNEFNAMFPGNIGEDQEEEISKLDLERALYFTHLDQYRRHPHRKELTALRDAATGYSEAFYDQLDDFPKDLSTTSYYSSAQIFAMNEANNCVTFMNTILFHELPLAVINHTAQPNTIIDIEANRGTLDLKTALKNDIHTKFNEHLLAGTEQLVAEAAPFYGDRSLRSPDFRRTVGKHALNTFFTAAVTAAFLFRKKRKK